MEDLNKTAEAVEARVATSQTSKTDFVAEARKRDEDARKEREIEATGKQLKKDQYNQDYDLIMSRMKKKESEITTDKLKARSAENDAYAAGGIDREEHENNLNKIEEEASKKLNLLRDEFDKKFRMLREEQPDGYRLSGRCYSRWD